MKDSWVRQVVRFFNPLAHLGTPKYSLLFPIASGIVLSVLSEIFALQVLRNPEAVGSYIIFVHVVLIMYFAFRDGIRGGFAQTATAIAYYFYIVYSRQFEGGRESAAIITIIVLSLLYFTVAAIIGWLKQTIDQLIISEKAARTEAEEDQARLQTLLEQLPVGVVTIDAQTNSMTSNKQAEKILGRKASALFYSEQSATGLTFKNNRVIKPKEWPLMRALLKHETIVAEELEYVKPDKCRIFIRINAGPIENLKGEVVGAVSTFFDVTQERELEQRKDDFVNRASHELKTPITSLKLYIELLLKRMAHYNDERANKALQSIKLQTERLQELINDLLDVSRIQTGKLHFNKEDFLLDQLVAETVDVLSGTTRNQELLFIGKKPIKVTADKFRIYQVLTNLITNAIKYSPEKSKIIVRIKKNAKKVQVSVQDFGIGISKGQQKKIFGRLYQVTEPSEKTFPGLGMGLYISKEIIKKHRGSIWVEGEKSKGSTFYFTLPLSS